MESKVREVLRTHVPAQALEYCFLLWQQNPFDFHVRKKRISKAGDFTCHHGRTPRITVNHDLSVHEFLITYVHEVAHLHVHKQLGFRAEPHGEEWKRSFQQLLSPLLTIDTFPEPVFRQCPYQTIAIH
jgi:SprT protein